MHLPTVLVTGFEPFDGADVNPRGEIARRLGELGHPDCHLIAEVLPVSFARAPQLLAAALDALSRGELVAVPTETVYGLGADATNDLAVARIFAAKGRPSFNPLIAMQRFSRL